ncbi:MAG: ion transporter [Sulfurimonadaceae bacterium]|jgi:voltage-gated sodium channel|nr:ion transporter [Sulfurimonadaceae bacterium]
MYKRIFNFVECAKFQNFIILLIIINGITMGLETSSSIMEDFGGFLHFFDRFVISIFTIEIALRIYVHRVSFFKDPWSLFDFTIVAISLVPASNGFEIFRVLRVLRLFRLITVVPQMKKIVMALLNTIPGMASIAALMTLFFYIFAIMATNLYGENYPEWFGNLGASFYTLFQIMTLESWSMGIVRPIMETHPNAWLFFVPFIFIVTFIMVNLIVAIVVDAMSTINAKEEENIIQEVQQGTGSTAEELAKLRSEISELKAILLSKK